MNFARIWKAAAAVVLLIPSLAVADPAGTYAVTGIDPTNGAAYRGTVDVVKSGEFYLVNWHIAGSEQKGIALGSGQGPAGPTHLSVAYGGSVSYGVAQYSVQPDGSWTGTWIFDGGKTVSTEAWTKADAAVREESQSPKPASKPSTSP